LSSLTYQKVSKAVHKRRTIGGVAVPATENALAFGRISKRPRSNEKEAFGEALCSVKVAASDAIWQS